MAVFSCNVTGSEAASQARWLAGSSSTMVVQTLTRSAPWVIATIYSRSWWRPADGGEDLHPHTCPQAVHNGWRVCAMRRYRTGGGKQRAERKLTTKRAALHAVLHR